MHNEPAILTGMQQKSPAKMVVAEMRTAGTEDRLIRSWYFEAISTEMPRAALEFIPACGHVPMEEDPVAFAKVIRNWRKSP